MLASFDLAFCSNAAHMNAMMTLRCSAGKCCSMKKSSRGSSHMHGIWCQQERSLRFPVALSAFYLTLAFILSCLVVTFFPCCAMSSNLLRVIIIIVYYNRYESYLLKSLLVLCNFTVKLNLVILYAMILMFIPNCLSVVIVTCNIYIRIQMLQKHKTTSYNNIV